MKRNLKKHLLRALSLSLVLAALIPMLSVALFASSEDAADLADTARGTLATAEEQAEAEALFRRYFEGDTLPFSFRLGDTTYSSFNEDFTVRRGSNGMIATHRDGIEVEVVWDYNFTYAEMEWQVNFTNTASENSAVLSEVYSLDISYQGETPYLNYSMGDVNYDPYIYTAYDTPLMPGMTMFFEPGCGKSTGHQRPYYRLTTETGGLILALGWQGRWKAEFSAEAEDGRTAVNIRGGQYEFSSYLKPGERVSTPSVVLLCFQGNDKYRAINMWRRWFYDCAAFRNKNGELMDPQISFGPSMSITPEQNEGNMIAQLTQYYNTYGNRPHTLYWIDAGWYPLNGSISLPETNSYWRYTGTWRVDTNRFPTKFADVRSVLADGCKMVLWFEPERVIAGTELFERKDLILSAVNDARTYLLNMGNPDAVAYAATAVLNILEETGAAIYRQDFNVDPYAYWYNADKAEGANRTGITENRYIQGLMSYYTTLLKELDYPIDMCASGAMRNDISVMKFSITLTVSDTATDKTIEQQNIRLCGNEWFSMSYGPGSTDPYQALSTLSYFSSVAGSEVWEEISHLMLGDYYPLTEASVGNDAWCAYQFYDQRYDEGFAVFIRRPDSEMSNKKWVLCGLDPTKKYQITELYTGKRTVKTGEELMTTGFGVFLGAGSGALYKFAEYNK